MKLKFLITFLALSVSASIYACKCSGYATISQSYKGSAIIFHGKVLGKKLVSFAETMKPERVAEIRELIRSDSQNLVVFENQFVFEVKLRVIENFKGANEGDTLTIYTTRTMASCGYPFEWEKEYIVYGLKKSYNYHRFLDSPKMKDGLEKENTHWTNHCLRTAEHSKPEEQELRKLNKSWSQSVDDYVMSIEKLRSSRALTTKHYPDKTFVGSLTGYYKNDSLVLINSLTDAEAAGTETLYYIQKGNLKKIFSMAAYFESSDEWAGYYAKHKSGNDCLACHGKPDCTVTEITFGENSTITLTEKGETRQLANDEKAMALEHSRKTCEELKVLLKELE